MRIDYEGVVIVAVVVQTRRKCEARWRSICRDIIHIHR